MTIDNDKVLIFDDPLMAATLRCKPRKLRTLRDPKLTPDPIPCFRLGKTYRYRWGSPEMEAWLGRQSSTTPTTNLTASTKPARIARRTRSTRGGL